MNLHIPDGFLDLKGMRNDSRGYGIGAVAYSFAADESIVVAQASADDRVNRRIHFRGADA